ncbi:MAG TPA: ATP synthase subunit I [Pyrinomonadaceae bacterium]|nr:ATP synthase subunit I [Pyrinomonadaceae bacterium]
MSEIADNAGRCVNTDTDVAAMERRLFRSMCVVVVLAVLISAPLAPWRVTTGLLLGGLLSLFNHHWLRTSIRAVFNSTHAGVRPRLNAARYVLRYFIIASIICTAYMLDVVSIVATLAGLCSFAVAVLAEAVAQIYFAIAYREET